MFKLQTMFPLMALGLLTACSSGGNDSRYSSAFQHLSIDGNGSVIAHALDGSEATVTSAGNLSIDGKPVAVTPAQQQLLKDYRDAAFTLRNDGVASGEAGLSTGMHVLGAVVSGLASGNPDSIDAKVNARADKVDALAQDVCRDLTQLYAAQGQLTVAIPGFTPYATIEPHEVSGCHSG